MGVDDRQRSRRRPQLGGDGDPRLEEDAARIEDLLADRDLEVVRPPEDWLVKVFVDDAMVDLIFRIGGRPVDQAGLADALTTSRSSRSACRCSARPR